MMTVFQTIKQKIKKLPQSPGVYLMKNEEGLIIYVGKAKSLKNRVSQYFQNSRTQAVKVGAMVEHVADFDYIVTDTEFEALVLECNLIKLHQPHYNILLKDDKQYPFIRVTMKDPYPKLMLARKKKEDGSRYFGPYPGGTAVREIISQIQAVFLISTCRKKFPQDIGKERACLNYHIKKCMAPCQGTIGQQEYHQLFEEIIDFLEGNYEKVVKKLEMQMEAYAGELAFEKAAQCRDKIRYMQSVGRKQKVYVSDTVDRDIIAMADDGFKTCFLVLSVRTGKLMYKDGHIFPNEKVENRPQALQQFITSYYSQRENLPKQIVTEHEIEDAALVSQLLTGLAGKKVEVCQPKRGELVAMLKMARENAREELSHVVSQAEKQEKLLIDIQALLGLSKPPVRIESYDISNSKNDAMLGAMIVYTNGAKNKEEYRMFHIRSITSQDDYAATKEVIYRRLEKAEAGDARFLPLPDLLLLDGGRGHVNAVVQMLGELGVDIPVFGMVKDGRHRLRGLIGQEGEIGLRVTSPLFSFFGVLSEEVHRFALSCHHKAQKKNTHTSTLQKIPGVGEMRRKALLRHFGSLKKIEKASEDELLSVPSMNRVAASAVWQHFRDLEKENRG